MLLINGRRAKAAIRDANEFKCILPTDPESIGFRPLFRGLGDQARRLTGCSDLPIEKLLLDQDPYVHRPTNFIGEISFGHDRILILVPTQKEVRAWEIRPTSSEPIIDKFCEQVAQGAKNRLDGRRLRGMNWNWEQLDLRQMMRRSPAGRVRRVGASGTLKFEEAVYTNADLEITHHMRHASTRDVLLRIAQVRKMKLSEFDDTEHSGTVQQLLAAGVLQREFLLLCRKDSHTICTMPDASKLDEDSVGGVTCAVCGRPFRDEHVSEILALSKQTTSLLEGSQWMTIWVTELLVQAGQSRDSIKWSGKAGEDELDIKTEVHDLPVFFELKDRDFGLGDAYPFVSRVTRYGGAHGVIATTGQVAEEAKNYLKETTIGPRARTKISSFEGPEEIESNIPKLLADLSVDAARSIVRSSFGSVAIDLADITSRWAKHALNRD